MSAGPVVLLTDFGHKDPFVGIMKGVIAGIAPKAQVVDLCHEVPPQDVRAAAFQLRASVPYFPKGALFVCVVDPGVGSARKILWARTARHQFLAPDNGLLSWVPEPIVEWREISNQKWWLPVVSATFHGRDIFAPVAAHLSRGRSATALGPVVKPSWELEFPEATSTAAGSKGAIIYFDRFGNAVTNMGPEHVQEGARIRFAGSDLGGVSRTYAGRAELSVMAVFGSSGFLELAVRNGNFKERFKASVGDPVESASA